MNARTPITFECKRRDDLIYLKDNVVTAQFDLSARATIVPFKYNLIARTGLDTVWFQCTSSLNFNAGSIIVYFNESHGIILVE